MDELSFGRFSKEDLDAAQTSSPAIANLLFLLKKTPASASDRLRIERHKDWITAAAATLLETHSPKVICRFWSDCADRYLCSAWNESGLADEHVALFALGKLGAQELNLSSDVDLLVVAETTPSPEVLKKFRIFNNLVAAATDFGAVLRTDYDLRPGGRFGPTLITYAQAEDYYWTRGATWERLAHVRLRKIAGFDPLARAYEDLIKKYTFRRHVDFTFVSELKKLRIQLHELADRDLKSYFNIKLGLGGIRDIELFAHALLVLHGGRRPELQHRQTDEILLRLAQEKIHEPSELQDLIQIYWKYRQYENKAQAINDEQTHVISLESPATKSFIESSTKKVHDIVSELLGKPQPREKLTDISKLGFNEHSVRTVWPQLNQLTVASKKIEDEELRIDFLSRYVQILAQDGIDKDLGLERLVDFLKATRAKASFYSLFINEPNIIRDLARLFSISPYLGQILSSRPELIDSFLYGLQPEPPEEIEPFLDFAAEKKLLNEIYAALALIEQSSVSSVCERLSEVADQITISLLDKITLEYGGAAIDILALGKWGSEELGLRSDLDFIFVSGAQTISSDEQKIARKFVSLLTAAQKGGAIYAIDLRLRPSGKAGPIIVSQSGLLNYLENEAAPWERQSYLRARSIRKNAGLEKKIHDICLSRPLGPEDRDELRRIRSELLKTSQQKTDLKYGAGGLIDIEFSAQLAVLANQEWAGRSTAEQLLKLGRPKLARDYSNLRRYEQLLALVSGTTQQSLANDGEEAIRLGQLLKLSPEDLISEIQGVMARSQAELKALDPENLSR